MITKLKFLMVFVVLIILSAGTALAQSTVLIDAAKKEGGKVVAYGSLESDTVDAIKQAFQKNTGLELEYWRASATKVMDRAPSEYRAGKPLFDVVLTNSAPMHILEKSGIFAKYDSPSAKEFPSAAIDPVLVALLLLFGWILWADGRRGIGRIVDQHHPNRSSAEIFALGDGVKGNASNNSDSLLKIRRQTNQQCSLLTSIHMYWLENTHFPDRGSETTGDALNGED